MPHTVYTNISPTIYGGPESLPSQSAAHLRQRKVFTGCNAGHTFFHADPHGRISICKVGRDEQISLIDEGAAGLARLGAIADSLLLRTGGCAGCQLSGACTVCRPHLRPPDRASPLPFRSQYRTAALAHAASIDCHLAERCLRGRRAPVGGYDRATPMDNITGE
jgi:hypothetical protein